MSIRRLISVVTISALFMIARPIAVRAADVTTPPAKPTIAVFTLTGPLHESPTGESLPLFEPPGVSLRELTARLTKAAHDANVKAVVVGVEGGSFGLAQAEELRQSIAALRATGKDVYVHAEFLTMRDYILFTGATRISVVPTGLVWVGGFYGEQPYLRGLLDMIGVRPEFLTCGDYKSAAEIFTRAQPSPHADEMTNWLLDSLFQIQLDLIAKGRNVTVDRARQWIDTGLYSADAAKSAGLIDAVEQRQELQSALREKYGKDAEFDRKYGLPKQPQIDFSNPFAMFKVLSDLFNGPQKPKSDRPVVGIVYVDGPILLGQREASAFDLGGSAAAYSSDVRRALDQAASDDQVKAVVLRVDSPGGSATASEIILDATRRLKAKKPLVVSMGDVAGSGGYYVTCAADTVFADAATITASIGVVSGKMVTTPMWNKVGITFKPYARGKNAALFNTSEPFTPDQRAQLQGWMDDIYGVFKRHVTDARADRLKKPIDQIAGGRVFTGRQALALGLVDKLGTLNDAIAFAAEEAKLPAEGYDVCPIPEPKNFIEQLMEKQSGDTNNRGLVTTPSTFELALPYLQGLDPRRVALIRQSLLRLDLIQREGATLMMPEIALPR